MFLSVESFTHIINKIKHYTDFVAFHVKGEPLLHPRLGDFLDIASQNAMQVILTTNGILLKKRKDVLLRGIGLRQINISLHTYTQLHPDAGEEYLAEIAAFLKELQENTNIIASIRLWNYHSANPSAFFKENYNALNMLREEFSFVNPSDFSKFLTTGIRISKNLYLNFDIPFIWPSIDSDYYKESGFCKGLRTHLAVLSDGTVVPCCLDSEGVISLGNILSDDLEAIMQSQRALAIYNGFSANQAAELLCKKCSFKEKFQ